MKATGAMRDRVRFERRTLDANGDRLGPWDTANPILRWADIWSRLGTEAVLAQRLVGTQPAEITVRADAETRSIDSSWRVTDDRTGVVYGIETAAEDDRRAFITFLAKYDGGGGGG